jgi:hypothetical protein
MKPLFILLMTALALQAQVIHVDDDASPGGDGSARKPFNNLPEAVAYANTASKNLTIHIAPGRYEVNETMHIQRGMTIMGSDLIELDSDELPTGNSDPASETRIVGGDAIISTMISVGKNGEVIQDVKFSGLTLQNGKGNSAIIDFARVQDFEVRDCILLGWGPLPPVPGAGINTFASSGTIRNTYTTRLLAAALPGAGYPASPANIVFRNNRAVGNRIGVFLVGTSDGISEPGDQLNAEIRNNDLSGNFEQLPSAGMRIALKGTETAGRPDWGVTGLDTGNIHAMVSNNRLVGNKVGIAIDAAFAYRRVPASSPPVCDTRTFHGRFDLTFRDNELRDSTFKPSIITFTQLQTTLTVLAGLPNYTAFQFLHNTTFDIDDRDGTLADAYILHPATDPFVGPPCSADVNNEVLGNTLRINGLLIPNTAP